ncbi:MAG: type VI secretion system ATPase TssH [Cellvibrionaceae bacterium]|nr:type VI secretion system ATPase TssH [Cellvibrionaceae bacterium]
MEFDRLVKNMSTESRDILEKSVAMASSKSHFSIEIEHWLFELLKSENKGVFIVLDHFSININALLSSLSDNLDAMRSGNDGFPKIGQDITRLLFESWMIASSQYDSLKIYSCHLLLAAIDNPKLKLSLLKISSEFEKISADDVRNQCENVFIKPDGDIAFDDGAQSKNTALDKFAINMTEQARAGKIDKILGRDNEVRQVVDILCRRRQNNPILTGEAGVGKTAIVEGLAEKIVSGNVPATLKGTELYSLDIGLLQAGAGVKGEFENRLKDVIKEVQNSPIPIIIFIDEAHTLIGSGTQSGAGDAANLLKPALARGELKTIAATTWAEYKQYFETDAALTRRFQVVKVEEPTEAVAKVMLRNMAPALESHHTVTILDEAISAAVTLSHRYIAGRQLPDKCVSLLDTACARVNLSLSATPEAIERHGAEINTIAFEMSRLSIEASAGIDHSEQLVALELSKASAQAAKAELEKKWQQEKEFVENIVAYRKQLEVLKAYDASCSDNTFKKEEHIEEAIKNLRKNRQSLADCQGANPLIYECVDAQVVAEVVADWTGVPVGKMHADEIDSVMSLQHHLESRVVGQPYGLQKIAQTMQTASAKLSDPRRPLGVFMLVGPSGVGKTETALALAEQLYGSDKHITTINMSEFKEAHKVSQLMGAPPGYVGYGKGGVLTEAVRRKPYSVILLDEMEKAHPGVQDIFYQVFDKGMLSDGEGRDVNFKNTVIIMTSNTASEQIEQLCVDPDTKPRPEALLDAIGPALREVYKPAFLGRINVIPYFPLEKHVLADIAKMQLQLIQQRIEDNYQVPLVYTDALIDHIIHQCQQSDAGARQIAMLLNNTLLPKIAKKILSSLASEDYFNKIFVDIDEHNMFLVDLDASTKNLPLNAKACV